MGVREDLIAAKALIDTPEKWDQHRSVVHAMLSARDRLTIREFNEMRDALLSGTDFDSVTMFAADNSLDGLLALFDRAIAKAGASHV